MSHMSYALQPAACSLRPEPGEMHACARRRAVVENYRLAQDMHILTYILWLRLSISRIQAARAPLWGWRDWNGRLI